MGGARAHSATFSAISQGFFVPEKGTRARFSEALPEQPLETKTTKISRAKSRVRVSHKLLGSGRAGWQAGEHRPPRRQLSFPARRLVLSMMARGATEEQLAVLSSDTPLFPTRISLLRLDCSLPSQFCHRSVDSLASAPRPLPLSLGQPATMQAEAGGVHTSTFHRGPPFTAN